MKKLIFTLLALVGTMSMNAQIVKIMKGNTVVGIYNAAEADNVVFEEEPPFGQGYAAATGIGYVKWVQLWEDGPKFAEYNVGAAIPSEKGSTMTFIEAAKTGDDYIWGANWRTPSKKELNELLLAANQIWNNYHLPVFITECGIGVRETSDENGYVDDEYRINYLHDHILALKQAVDEDGIDLIGFLTWGPIDILSSAGDMDKRYGFIYVNRDNHDLKDLKRSKKRSFDWYKQVIESNGEIIK